MGSKEMYMSATRMSMFLECRWKYWCRYILHLPRKSNPAFKFGLALHDVLQFAGDIFKDKKEFNEKDKKNVLDFYTKVAAQHGLGDMGVYKEGLTIVSNKLNDFGEGDIILLEDKFKVDIGSGVITIGAMDKVCVIDNNTLLVVDYKTSKYFLTSEELAADIQLSIYDLVAAISFKGEYDRIILCLDYLRGDCVYTYRTDETRKLFLDYVVQVYEEMCTLKESEAKQELNNLCGWCDFSDSCEAYQKVVSKSGVDKLVVDKMTDAELIKAWRVASVKKKILDGYEYKLKNTLMERISKDLVNIEDDAGYVYIRQNKRKSYDVKKLSKVVTPNQLLKMTSVVNNKVDEFVSKYPAKKVLINDCVTTNYNKPFLASKKRTKGGKA